MVPWTAPLEQQLGRHVSDVARDDGGIDWSFWAMVGAGIVSPPAHVTEGYSRDNIPMYCEGYAMPLYVKDQEVDRLAERLAALRKLSKTEAVRQALQNELEREEGVPSLVDKGVAFVRALHLRARPSNGKLADKAFIDSLYGEP